MQLFSFFGFLFLSRFLRSPSPYNTRKSVSCFFFSSIIHISLPTVSTPHFHDISFFPKSPNIISWPMFISRTLRFVTSFFVNHLNFPLPQMMEKTLWCYVVTNLCHSHPILCIFFASHHLTQFAIPLPSSSLTTARTSINTHTYQPS